MHPAKPGPPILNATNNRLIEDISTHQANYKAHHIKNNNTAMRAIKSGICSQALRPANILKPGHTTHNMTLLFMKPTKINVSGKQGTRAFLRLVYGYEVNTRDADAPNRHF